jgi:uncharacterized protein DUF6311
MHTYRELTSRVYIVNQYEVQPIFWPGASALKAAWLPCILGAFLGVTAFLLMYGPKILNPEFAEWLLQGDPAQHFLGWHFFRSEAWTFPVGAIRSYLFPVGTSIVYTDSIPLVAIPLKLLSPLLPNIFQYEGIWALSCYLLQGLVASLLINRITSNLMLIGLGAIFFILSPILYFRAIGHNSLAAHWIILLALYLYFEPDDFRNRFKWIILLSIAPAIHFYLLFMIFIVWIGYLWKSFLNRINDQSISLLLFFVISVLTIVIISWVEGAFVLGIDDTRALGFGYYSMNLLSPIYLRYSPATPGQYEGFNYLGLGLLALVVISIYEITRHQGFFRFSRDAPLMTVCLILLIFSLSNQITFSEYLLVWIPLPNFIEQLFSTFRVSGRMFWPVTYVGMIYSLAIIIKYNSLKRSIILLILSVSVQCIEFYPVYSSIPVGDRTWISPLRSKLWIELAKEYSHLTFIPPQTIGDQYIPFALLAVDHGMTLNVGYTARTNVNEGSQYKSNLLKAFAEGELLEDALYILNDCSYYPNIVPETALKINLDGYIVIAPQFEEKFKNLMSSSMPQGESTPSSHFSTDPCRSDRN